MDSLSRHLLLACSILYFMLCIAAGMESSPALHQAMIAFFIAFGIFVLIRYLALLASAMFEKHRSNKIAHPTTTPYISIIVPAFNEQTLIADSLSSLATLDYPDYEIIVVDDGSTDATTNVVGLVSVKYPYIPIKVICQTNAGKAWALNTGIVHAKGEIIVCVDADSQLSQQSLRAGVGYFQDPRVAAVGGYVDVLNEKKTLPILQQLEYIIGQNFFRRALSIFSIVTVVPGPIGMFRKQAILDVGGYNTSKNCFAEDAELTVRLLARGWRVKGDTNMVAYTEAPESLYALLRQRYRWTRGIFQAFYENQYNLITASNASGLFIVGLLAFESFLFEIVNFGLTLFALTSFLSLANFRVFIWTFIVLATLDLWVFLFTHIGYKRLLYRFFMFAVSRISYAYILQAWGVLALFDELLSAKMGWDKLERIGHSQPSKLQ